MNITLIRKQDNLYKVRPAGSRIVEYYRDPDVKFQTNISVFDPESNTLTDVSPRIRKMDYIRIINCIYKSRDLYFASCDVIESGRVEINVYRYRIADQQEQLICTFVKSHDILSVDRRLRLFVLSESYLLMQTEIRVENSSRNVMGNIEFSLSLFNLDNGKETEVIEANLLNNGIDVIIPVTEKKIMIKTGRSYLEEPWLSDDDSTAFIEGVYLTTTAKFIADITLAKDFVDMPLIESVYQDKHITRPKVTDEYIHFSILDEINQTAKCVFYHQETEERNEYIISPYDPEDLSVTYVIDHIPYVRKQSSGSVDFINLKKAQIDLSFYDEDVIAQVGKLIICAPQQRRKRIHVYVYPKLHQVLDEPCSFVRTCFAELNDGEDYYIYC